MALATLSIDLEAKLAKLEQGMDKSVRIAQKSANGIEREFGKLKSVAGAVGGAFAAAFAGVSVVALVRNTIDGIDALNDLKDATGSTIENISALEDIALRTGGTFAGLSTTMIRFTQVLKDADEGSVIANILKQIGLDAEELKRIDPADALHETAKALARFKDDGQKAQLVQELFGRSVAEVAPLLKDLAEQTKLVATVTTEQAAEAEKFNKQLAAMQKNVADVARDLAGPLITSLNETIDKFKEGAKEGKNFYQVIREEQLKLLGIGGAAPGMQKQSGVVTQMMTIDELRRLEAAGQGLGSVGGIPPADKKDGGKKTKAAKPGESAEFDQIDAFRRAELEATDAVNKALDSSKWATWEKERSERLKKAADDQERLNALLEATPTGKLEKQREEMQFLADALMAGKINAAQFSEAAQAALGTLPPEFEKLSEFALEAQRNIQDALGETLKRTLKGDFESIGDLWGDMLLDMAAQAAAAQLNEYLFGKPASGGVGGTTGVLTDIIGGIFGGGRASGGPVSAGRMYEVNERGGPGELLEVDGKQYLMATRNGRVKPNSGGAVGGGSVVLHSNPTIYIDSRTDQAQVGQIAFEAAATANKHFAEELRAAGVMA